MSPTTRTKRIQMETNMKQGLCYLVTFYGIPDWEGVTSKQPCARRYLFSSEEKASAFVSRRTDSPEWLSPSTLPKGSMATRLKKGSSNRYNIVALALDREID